MAFLSIKDYGVDIKINIPMKDLKKLDKYAGALSNAIIRGISNGKANLRKKLKAQLYEQLSNYGLANSRLANSARVDKLKVSVNATYGNYVEYGTGIVGARSVAHPDSDGWIHDINGHGDKGWYYPIEPGNKSKVAKYYNGQAYGWTKGQPARPFMYNTQTWARYNWKRVVGESVKRAILKEISKIGG